MTAPPGGVDGWGLLCLTARRLDGLRRASPMVILAPGARRRVMLTGSPRAAVLAAIRELPAGVSRR
jgi:hypothetical protein